MSRRPGRVSAWRIVILRRAAGDDRSFPTRTPPTSADRLSSGLRAGCRAAKTYERLHLGWVSVAVIGALAAGEGLTALIQRAGGYRVLPHGVGEYLPRREVLPGRDSRAPGTLVIYLPDLYRCVPPAP